MLIVFFILLFVHESTAITYPTPWPYSMTSQDENIHRSTITATFHLNVVAIPDYPVAAGQTVHLHCNTSSMSDYSNLYWQHLKNLTWQQVSNGNDLTLTEPKQSGLYQCCLMLTQKQCWKSSRSLTVLIIDMPSTVSDHLGVAAIFLSLLSLIITLALLGFLIWQRYGNTQTTSTIAAKSFPEPAKTPKGHFPQTERDGDEYMNYTSTNRAYTDLDPTHMTADNVYSSLS